MKHQRTFFYFLFWRSPEFEHKNRFSFGEDLFFFFGDHMKIRTKVCHFPCVFWTSRNQTCVIFELSPGPPSALGAPDSTIGSLSFVASEYHDFRKKIVSITSENLEIRKTLSGLTEANGMMDKNLTKTKEQLEALEQYGGPNNLETHNILWTRNEKTNEIVKKIVNTLNVKLDYHDISISHRLYSNQTPKPYSPNINFNPTEAEANEHPLIIVRFAGLSMGHIFLSHSIP